MSLQKEIKVSNLKAGFRANFDYYSNDGKLLLPKNSILTEDKLEKLNNNFYKFLYIKKPRENLGSKLDKLKLENEPIKLKKDFLTIKNPILDKIDFHHKSIEELQNEKEVKNLQNIEKRSNTNLQTIGVPLSSLIKKKINFNNNKTHIERINKLYDGAIDTTKTELTKIAYNKKTSILTLHDIIKSFNSLMLEDSYSYAKLASKRAVKDEDFHYFHALNTALLTMNIAIEAGYGEKQIYDLALSALLSDIGMLLVPQEILYKPNKLTQDEFYQIKKHPISGFYITNSISKLPDLTKIAIYQLHERGNKLGYPRGIGSHLINDATKLIQIADIYDALTSSRNHRPALTPFDAIKTMTKMSLQDEISKKHLKLFLNRFSMFPIGSFVRLNDNSICKVIDVNKEDISRPTIKVVFDNENKMVSNNRIINLLHQKKLSIIESFPYDTYNKEKLFFGI